MIWRRHEIIPDLRGRDKMWQFIELSGVVWLILFPGLVVCSLYGLDVSAGVWSTMDAVYFINILGRNAHKFIEARWGIPPEKES